MKNLEFWKVVKTDTNTGTSVFKFLPGDTGCILLDRLARGFERYVIRTLTIHYRPSVGTTKDGIFCCAVDWDASDEEKSQAKIKAMFPQVRVPVWQPADLPLNARLQEKKTMKCTGSDGKGGEAAFAVGVVAPNNTEVGELLLAYHVEFMGPSGN